METLYGNDAIQELLKLLEVNRQEKRADDLSMLSWYVDDLERQYNAVLQELQDVKIQLAEAADAPAKERNLLQRTVDALEDRMWDIRDALDSVRETVCEWAQNTVEEIKERGVLALDKIASLIGVKEKLEDIRESIQQSVEDTRETIGNLESVGRELRSAGSHLKNAGRAAVGKEVRRSNTEKEGLFQSVVLAPIRGIQGLLSHMNNGVLAAIGAVERLEHTSEVVRDVRSAGKKPSIRQALAQRRAEAAAPAAPAPEQARRHTEAAL